MTPQEIDAMPAGRELDALVAERVMGWTRIGFGTPDIGWPRHIGTQIGYPANAEFSQMIPAYSTDIAAAWKVVDVVAGFITAEARSLLRTSFPDGYNYLQLTQCGHRIWAATWGMPYIDDDDWIETANMWPSSAKADTAPLAICLATLKVAMELGGTFPR